VARELAESLAQHPWSWLAVVMLGAYHGVNPGMGWLFAVSNGMQARRASSVFLALLPIALGHFLAMGASLLAFALLGLYLERIAYIQVTAGLILVGFGVYKLALQRHPRFLARIGPSHLVLWSFLMATAHGAGLMLVPIVLALYASPAGVQTGQAALTAVAGGNLGIALIASTLHTLAMVLAGGAIAWVVYQYVGLGLLRRAWLNLDLLWAVLLIIIGGVALAAAL
jgi:hypothetical protein